MAIPTRWGIAFFEYCLMVPANRMGFGRDTLTQLKGVQEVLALGVFAVFAVGVVYSFFRRSADSVARPPGDFGRSARTGLPEDPV